MKTEITKRFVWDWFRCEMTRLLIYFLIKEYRTMRALSIISLVLMIVGALNWGLVGLFGFNLVTWIFGFSTAGIIATRIVYILVGLAGLYGIFMEYRLAERTDDVCVPGHRTVAANL